MLPTVCVTSAPLPNDTSMRIVRQMLIDSLQGQFCMNDEAREADVHIHVGTPHEMPSARPSRSKAKFIFYTSSEATRVPDNWVHTLNQCSEVWTPSQFAYDALLASGVHCPIRVIPHGVESRRVPTPRHREDKQEPFSFMWQGARLRRYEDGKPYDGDRKRGYSVEKAFLAARLPNSRLILKYLPIEGIEYDVRAGCVWYICKSMSTDELAELDAWTDVFIWPTMGEGFGMPPLEKLASGIPAFATFWSGPMEYQRDFPLRRLLPTELQPVLFNGAPAHMANVDESSIVELMTYCYENRTELSKMRADLFTTARRWSAEQMLKPRLVDAVRDVSRF